LAGSSGLLIAGRALQGLGAALVSPAALSIVMTTFSEGRERTRALGIWSAIAAGGGAVGLLLGGLLTDTLSWRWVFFINLPIGIVRVRSLTSANVAMLFVMSGLFGMFYFASIYVQEILGYSPLKAGIAFVPVTFGIVIGAGLAQSAIRSLGVRLVPIAGIALAALGL